VIISRTQIARGEMDGHLAQTAKDSARPLERQGCTRELS
jgi:hypothetical protein